MPRQHYGNTRNRGPAPNIRPGLAPTLGPGNATISRPVAPTYGTTTPRTPQIYHVAPESNDSSTASHPQYTPSQSHTPRSFGNTHDDDEYNEEAYFMDHEHGCNVIGCPHHHDE